MTPARARATVVVVVVAAGIGAAAHVAGGGPKSLPCPAPGLGADGALVCDGSGGPLGDRAWLFGHKLDLNTASADSLARIRGVGPSVANAIVAHRKAHGPFRSVDELDDVKGVGPKLMAAVAAAAEVRPQPTTTPAPTTE